MKAKLRERGFCATRAKRWHTSVISKLVLLLMPALLNGQPSSPAYQTVDLAPYLTTRLANAPAPISAFPQGTRSLGGVPFAIAGMIELTGMDEARHGELHPGKVTGLALNQKALQIELLHGARHGQKAGTPLANLILHFKNGDVRTNRLAFGVHAGNYLEEGS